MTNHSAPSNSSRIFWNASTALALALCLGVATVAQEQQDQSQSQQQDQQAQQQADQSPPSQTPDRPAPAYASQDADKPPYSRDSRLAPSTQAAPTAPAVPSQSLPSFLTIPAGTVLLIRTNDLLSSDNNRAGDSFTAVLDQPIVVNGWVVARRGQTLIGKVKDAKKAGHIKGTSELDVELTDLTIVDGRQLPILTELWKGSGGTSHGQDVATVGTTTGLGALIGAAADWGRGAAIGAGAGAAVGLGAVLLTRGRPTIVEPETPLSFRLVDPVKVDTAQSQQAFLPVSQQDFDGGHMEHRGPRRVAVAYPGPYGYPCGYYGPCYGYPYPYVGFYGVYGHGYYGHRGWRY